MRTTCGLSLRVWKTLLALGCGLFALVAWLVPTPPTPVAAATTYTVNSNGDTGAGSDTLGDLRYAINQVNAGSGGNTIVIAVTGVIQLNSALPALAKNVAIVGPASGPAVMVDGGCTFTNGSCTAGTGVTVFTVNLGVTVGISNLTIQHGNGGAGSGGGIANVGGTLTVTNCTLTENSATNGGGIANNGATTLVVTNSTLTSNSATTGGGIYNTIGPVTVVYSTLTGNSATNGGGIYTFGTATVTNSTLSGNTAATNGGGIYNLITLTMTNSTLSGNTAPSGSGGGIYNIGTATVTNSTLISNSATSGGGINNQATLTLTNTIVANSPSGGDIGGSVTTPSHSLLSISGGGITNGDAHGDIVTVTPLLGALSTNGSPTQTIPLLAGSPAIAHGDPTVCASTTAPAAAPVGGKDQRGAGRAVATCAIGAFEPQTATYIVGSGSDTGAMATLTTCADVANTTCKLRDALAYASSGQDTIAIASVLTGGQTITLTNDPQHGTLTLQASVTIAGPTSGAGVIIDGGCTFSGGACTSGTGVRVFLVNSGVTASISNLTIRHGNAAASNGGGILNNGTLTLTNSTLTANSATFGGGILNAATLMVTNSTFSANFASLDGGGIHNTSPNGALTLRNGTIAGNQAGRNSGGIHNISSVAVTNTIVASNTAATSDPDLTGAFPTGGHNLVGNTSGSTGIGNADAHGNIVNPSPGLGALGSNGGPTQTLALLAGSPAIGNGDPSAAGCASTGASGVNGKDQRGLGRSALVCDIGAYESSKTYTVGSTSDTAPAGTLGQCQSAGNTACRLRDAIGFATGAMDTIQFNSHGAGKITLAGGRLTLAASVTIAGPTSGTGVIVDGGCSGCDPGPSFNPSGGVGVFKVNSGVTANLSNLTIQHGNNTLGDGGGIGNSGTLSVTNSTISGNSAGLDDGTAGGGIYNTNNGTVTVTNSTITGNSAKFGGGIYNSGPATVTNSTIAGNNAVGGNGGGILNAATLMVTNTIVAGNSATGSGPDVFNGVTSGGHNLIGNTSGGSGFVVTDVQNANPLLGALGNNGGPTQTLALLAGSPAIGAGDPAVCNQTGAGMVNGLDQRGVTRPTTLCAIGAVEPLLSAVAPGSGPIAGGATVTLTGAGFAAGAAVSIGGVSCTNVHIVNSTTLTCTTGAGAAGAADVVATVNSQTGTLTSGYTYGGVTPLPGGKSPGSPAGSPAALPGSRPGGAPNGSPNPLPASRP